MRGFALHCNTVTVRWRRARGVQGFARWHARCDPGGRGPGSNGNRHDNV